MCVCVGGSCVELVFYIRPEVKVFRCHFSLSLSHIHHTPYTYKHTLSNQYLEMCKTISREIGMLINLCLCFMFMFYVLVWVHVSSLPPSFSNSRKYTHKHEQTPHTHTQTQTQTNKHSLLLK